MPSPREEEEPINLGQCPSEDNNENVEVQGESATGGRIPTSQTEKGEVQDCQLD